MPYPTPLSEAYSCDTPRYSRYSTACSARASKAFHEGGKGAKGMGAPSGKVSRWARVHSGATEPVCVTASTSRPRARFIVEVRPHAKHEAVRVFGFTPKVKRPRCFFHGQRAKFTKPVPECRDSPRRFSVSFTSLSSLMVFMPVDASASESKAENRNRNRERRT